MYDPNMPTTFGYRDGEQPAEPQRPDEADVDDALRTAREILQQSLYMKLSGRPNSSHMVDTQIVERIATALRAASNSAAPAERTRVEGEQAWKCACGWRGTPSQMTTSNTLRTCPRCGGSGGLILDTAPSDSARRAAEEISSTFGLRFQESSLRHVTAIISKHAAATSAEKGEPQWLVTVRERVSAERVIETDTDWDRGYNEAIDDALAAIDRVTATAPADNDAESVALIIAICGDCPFVDHSGAFTEGGAKAICGHRNAPDTFAATIEGDDRYHWKYRQVDREAAPPAQCPLRATTTKGDR